MKKTIQFGLLLVFLACVGGCAETQRLEGWKRGRLSEREAYLRKTRITCDLTKPSLLDIINVLETHYCLVYVSGYFLTDEWGKECLKMKSPHDLRVNNMELKNFLMWANTTTGVDTFVIRRGSIYVIPKISTSKDDIDRKPPNKRVQPTAKQRGG